MAALQLGGSVLGALLEVVFDKLGSRAIHEIGVVSGLKKDLRSLHKTLNSIERFRADAESRLATDPNNKGLESWIDDLRGGVYEAHDVLDELEYEQLSRKVEGDPDQAIPIISYVSNAYSGLSNACSDYTLAGKIEALQDTLKEILELADVYHLKSATTPPKKLGLDAARRMTSSLPDSQTLIGRDSTKERVIKLLRSAQYAACGETAAVVSITGMAGIGKTTLAQHVYNDQLIQEEFKLKMWVCVSEDFEMKKLTSEVLESATNEQCADYENLNVLQKKLKDKLTGKKFLLVLDDVWNEDAHAWDSFKKPLVSGGETGSKILVTTRNEKVAEIMSSTESIPLEELSDEDLWSLFESFAFAGSNADRHRNFEWMGRQIAKKLKGSPLAAKTVGGLLRSNFSTKHWRGILESEIWKLEQKEHDIMPSLRLSYEHLPEEVKPCFAFCSLFPKDHHFDKNELVSMWMAHDYIRPREGKLPEDVGMDYIDFLLSRSMFQLSTRTTGYGDKSIIMHDLMQDLAQMVSRGECYIARDEEELRKAPKTIRHLYISYNSFEGSDLNEMQNLRKVRTLILDFGVVEASPQRCLDLQVISKAERLRLLRISAGRGVVVSIPVQFESKHLRYLDLDCRLSEASPQSISTLYNLRELKYNSSISIPTGIIRKHSNLRNINKDPFRNIELSGEIRMLSELQNLKFRVPSEGNHGITELTGLNHLRRLEIHDLENVPNSAVASQARLTSKKHLDELLLGWTPRTGLGPYDGNVEAVLEGLRPPKNISKLRIENYNGVGVPSWMSNPSLPYIEVISLVECSSLSSLPWGLSKFSLLRCLRVESCPEIRSFPQGGLPSSLRTLSITDLPDVADLEAARLDQTNLHRLDISKCPSLRCLPENGLPSSLRDLWIDDCPTLKQRCRRDGGLDWIKISRVPSVMIDDVMVIYEGLSLIFAIIYLFHAPSRGDKITNRILATTTNNNKNTKDGSQINFQTDIRIALQYFCLFRRKRDLRGE